MLKELDQASSCCCQGNQFALIQERNVGINHISLVTGHQIYFLTKTKYCQDEKGQICE
jgi:hypothetical protein